jgi:hypothetical protein
MRTVAIGVEQEWLIADKVTQYRITSISISSLSILSEDILETLENQFSIGCNLGVLLDISASGVGIPFLALTGQNIYNVGFTTIGRQKIRNLLKGKPEFHVDVAIIVSSNLSGKLASAKTHTLDIPNNLIPRLFHTREHGLTWLSEQFDASM